MRLSALIVSFYLLASAAGAAPERVVPISEITHVHGVAFDPLRPNAVYLATHTGIFRADLSGLAIQVSPDRNDYMGFTTTPGGLAMLASGHPEGGGNLGVIRSTDGALSWEVISPGDDGPVDFHALAVAPLAPDIAYGLYQRGIQISVDGGLTWTWVGPAPAETFDIAASGSEGKTLFAATSGGVQESSNSGASWTPLAGDIGAPTSLIEATSSNLYAFVVGTGLVQRQYGASAWTTLANDFGDEVLLHLAVSPSDPSTLIGITQNSRILLSRDGGATWAPFG